MTIDPLIISKPRTGEDRSRSETTVQTSPTSGQSPDRSDIQTDQVHISLEARALSGDTSLDDATLDRFQKLARQSIDQLKKSEEQIQLVKSLLGFGI